MNQRSLNLQMVRQGSATVYCKHLRDCAGSEPFYLSAENAAKQEKLGIWNSQQSWQLPEGRPCAILNN